MKLTDRQTIDADLFSDAGIFFFAVTLLTSKVSFDFCRALEAFILSLLSSFCPCDRNTR